MAFIRETSSDRPVSGPPCVHLRTKAMYVTGTREGPDHADDDGGHHWWCNLTQHVIGPDDGTVSRCDCSDGRSCFRAAPE